MTATTPSSPKTWTSCGRPDTSRRARCSRPRSTSACSRRTLRRPRSASTCTWSGPASPACCPSAGTTRSTGCWRMRRPASCSPSATARPATTSCCSTPRPGGARRRRVVRVHRHEDLHLARAGLDAPRHLRSRRQRSRESEARARLHHARDAGLDVARRLGHTRHARDPEPHDGARRRGRSGGPHRAHPAVGPSGDPFIFGIFANFLLLIASVYAGVGDRALELGVEAVGRRTSLRNDGKPYSQDPDLRWRIADAALALDALAPQIETLAADVDNLVNHGAAWFRRLTGVKHRATETARYVVDQSARVAGGGGYRSSSELARLQRDVLAGIYHPSDTESVHNTVATNLLGPLD